MSKALKKRRFNMLSKGMSRASLEVTAIYADALGAEEKGIAARMWN